MKPFVCFFLCFVCFHVTAQEITSTTKQVGVIAGTLVDNQTKEPMPYASVSLKDPAAKIVTGSITDEKGDFKLSELPLSRYTIEIQFIGYQTIIKEITLTKNETKVNLGTLLFQPDATRLKEVVITGEKLAVALKLDKKVFEVGKDILAQSGSAHDVLNNVPSVTVNPAGVVSLRGNSNVHILVNGRRSGLTLSNALDQIPADNIERVEVITNPSARYEAAGSAGIINIILKKNRESGFSGQARLVTGFPNDARISPGLNYKSDKLNIFSTFGYRQSDYVGFYTTNQTTTNHNQATVLNRVQNENRHDDGKLLYLGTDYFINTHNTLTAAFFKNATLDTDQTTLSYDYCTLVHNQDSTITRSGHSKEIRNYNQLEFNYTKTYPVAEKKWTVDMQYDFWNSNKTWNLVTQKVSPVPGTLPRIKTSSVGSSQDFVLQTDFVNPLTAKYTLELGLKLENRLVTSEYRAEALTNDSWQVVDNIDNTLDYNERIGSAYTQFGNKENRFSYLLGLRSELSHIKTKDRTDTFIADKKYFSLFPTVNLGYSFKEETTMQASYSKRINRPFLGFLYPFNELTDFNAQFIGNPDLNPAFTHAFELVFLRNWPIITFNPAVYYQRTSDYVQFYTFRNTDGVFITSPINLEKESRYGFEWSVTYNPVKWLQLSEEFNIYHFQQQGIFGEQNFAFSDYAWNTRVNTQLKFPHQFTFQTRYNFTSAQNNAQSQTRAIYYVDAGLSKILLKDKVTLVIDGSNVFNSRQTRTRTAGENYTFTQALNYNAARYRLSFVYRFNKKEGQSDRQAKSGNRS